MGMIDEVYELLAQHYGELNICLAGGAVRDTVLGKPVKDWDFIVKVPDITVYSTNWLPNRDYDFFIRCFSRKPRRLGGEGYDNKFEVFEFKYKDETIQLLFHSNIDKPSDAVLDRFDTGICMIWYDRINGVQASNAFLRSWQRKTLHVYRKNLSSDYQIARTKDTRVPKLLKKFPEFDGKVVWIHVISPRYVR